MKVSAASAMARSPRRRGCVSPQEWWELEQYMNGLLGLDPYGEEPDNSWGGKRAAVREALIRFSRDPAIIRRWLERGGAKRIRRLVRGPLTHEAFDIHPPCRVMQRLRTLLCEMAALPPTEEELAEGEQLFRDACARYGASRDSHAGGSPA